MNASPAVEREEASETDLHRVVLVADRVSKAFPGVLALDDVSFEVRASEAHQIDGRILYTRPGRNPRRGKRASC